MFQDFISLVFPRYCLSCLGALTKGEQTICTPCRYSLPKTHYHKNLNNPVRHKFLETIRLKYAFAYLKFVKHGKVQQLLHSLKYENHPEIGLVLGRWFGYDLKEDGFASHFDLIIPVPLHRSKLRIRGYNQSDPFAEGLSEALGIKWSGSLMSRVKKSETQTQKSRIERWKNVERIFEVVDVESVKSKRVLLVDDVITTGATLESCATALLNCQVREVSVGTIAASQ